MNTIFTEWWSFFNDHWNEMLVIDYEKDFVSKKNVDWDVPFVFVVGSYNTKGNLAEMAEACIDWQTRHLVGDGLQLGGGVTKHYEESGERSRVFWCFQNHSRFCHFHQYTWNTKYRC